ncbi:MAG: PAS domain S-box protein [Methanomassiliicoccales archaeon]
MISVLCIDDEESVIEQVKAHLGRTGDILVEGSPSTPQALEMLKVHHYDAIIVRHGLHGMDAQRFLGHVRSRAGSVPVVFLFGKGVRIDAEKSLMAHPNIFLEPVPTSNEDFDELATLVRETVALTTQEELVSFAGIAAERMGIATIAIDRSGRVSRFNRETCRIFGYTDEELLTKQVWDLLGILAKDTWASSWNRLEQSGQVTTESVGKRKDGTTFPIDIITSMETLGGSDYVVAVVRDMTGRKSTEEKLRETIESYKSLAENLPGIVYRVKVREDGRMLFYNDMLKPITGYEADELGRGDACSIEQFIVDDDREMVKHTVSSATKTGEPFEVQYRLRAKDGGIRHLVERGRPLMGPDGMPLYIDGVIFDVTDQKMAEASERELELRLRKISGLLPAAIFEADLEGNIKFMNEATSAMSGYSREEIAAGPWSQLVAPEDRDVAVRLSLKAMKEGATLAAEVHLISRDGRRIPVSANWTPIAADGGISGVVGMLLDVTTSRGTEKLQNAINRIVHATVTEPTLDELYVSIHKVLAELMPAGNFYIALASQTKNELTFPYFVDERDLRPEPRKVGNGLTEYIISSGKPLWGSGEDLKRMNEEGKFEIVGSLPYSFIGVPLVTKRAVIGAMAMQSYDARLSYGSHEIDILQFVSYQVAQAIERRRNEEEIQRSLSMLQGVFDSTADGLLIVDTSGSVLALNDRFARMWSIPDSIASTKDDSRLLAFVLEQLKEPETFMSRVRFLYENPLEPDFETLAFKDGRFFERYSQPYQVDGRVMGRIWSFRDVTERRRAEDGLRQSEAELKAIINSAKDLIFVKDMDGNYRMVNDAMVHFFNRGAEEFIGKNAIEVFEQSFAGKIISADRQALAGETVEHEMTPVVAGSVRILSVIKAPLRGRNGEIIGICGIARDMTERKKVEKALQEANASLDILNSITRHDVLNQLMVVRGYSDLVRSALKDKKDLEHMDKIEKATRTIRSQILFTKDFQKLGSVEPKWQSVEELFDSAFSTLEMGPVEISVDLRGLEVYADPMLEKVFYNLVDNSLRHGERVTEISVDWSKEHNGLQVKYEDNGVGIKAEDKSRIFDRAFGKNTGLGLFLAKAILGVTSIKIDENGVPGEGVKFTMHIPDGSYRFQDYDRER